MLFSASSVLNGPCRLSGRPPHYFSSMQHHLYSSHQLASMNNVLFWYGGFIRLFLTSPVSFMSPFCFQSRTSRSFTLKVKVWSSASAACFTLILCCHLQLTSLCAPLPCVGLFSVLSSGGTFQGFVSFLVAISVLPAAFILVKLFIFITSSSLELPDFSVLSQLLKFVLNLLNIISLSLCVMWMENGLKYSGKPF